MTAGEKYEEGEGRTMKEATQVTHSVFNEALPKADTIVRPAKRSRWRVNSKNKQRVLLAGDESGSMAGAKATQAHAGCQQLTDNLALPENRNGFYVGVIFFNDDARIVCPWTAATALVGNVPRLNPDGCTDIEAAFRKALEMLKEAQKQDENQKEYTFLRPGFFFYSDGQKTKGSDPRPVANEVKALADVVTIAVGSDSDDSLLQELATSPAHFYKVTDANELRKFLADAGATVTQSFQRGEDATQVMTQIQKS